MLAVQHEDCSIHYIMHHLDRCYVWGASPFRLHLATPNLLTDFFDYLILLHAASSGRACDGSAASQTAGGIALDPFVETPLRMEESI